MPTPLLPDVVDLAITALAAQPSITALVSTRIYNRIPDSPTWPLLVVGTVDEAELEFHTGEARVQVDCWGASGSPTDEQATRLIARTIVAAHRDLRGTYAAGRIYNSGVESVVPAPDPDSGRARLVVDLSLQTHA